MNRHFLNYVTTLMAVPVLAVMGLLTVFLLLGQSTVGATPDGNGTIPDSNLGGTLRIRRPRSAQRILV